LKSFILYNGIYDLEKQGKRRFVMKGKNDKILGGAIHHIALRASDFEKSIKFYTDGLGFVSKISWGEGKDRGIMLDTGDGSCLELFAGGTDLQKPEGAFLHLAFCTDHCDTALARACEAGAVATMKPTDINMGGNPANPVRIAFCKGPDGELIEFYQEAR